MDPFPENPDSFDLASELPPIDRKGTVHFSIDALFSRSWDIFRADGPRIMATFWSALFLTFLPLMLQVILFTDPQKFRQKPTLGERLFSFVAFGVTLLIYAGILLFFTNLAAGRWARFGDLFRCRKFAWSILLTYLLMNLVSLGLMVFIFAATMLLGEAIGDYAILFSAFIGLPVLTYVTLSLSQTLYLIVDREVSPIDALRLSWALMRGHRLEFLFLNFLNGLANILGFLAFGFGLLVSVPFSIVSLTVFYLAVSGQPIADPYASTRIAPPPPRRQ